MRIHLQHTVIGTRLGVGGDELVAGGLEPVPKPVAQRAGATRKRLLSQ
jgi:hypothetical protein